MSCALGLIALGVGYLVFLQANKEKEGLRILGQVIGILIMIAAVLSSLCAMKDCKKGGACGMDKKPMCPISAKAAHEAQP